MLILAPDALLIKLTGHIGAFENTLIRSIFMALSWALMVRLWKGDLVKSLLAVSRVGLLAAVLLAVDRLFFIEAVRMTSVTNMLAIFAAVPAFAGLIAYFVFREKVRHGQVPRHRGKLLPASLIIFMGDLGGGSLYGNAMAVLAALFYALYIVCMRFSKREEVLEIALPLRHHRRCRLPSLRGPRAPSRSQDVGLIAFQSALLLPIGFALYFAGTRYPARGGSGPDRRSLKPCWAPSGLLPSSAKCRATMRWWAGPSSCSPSSGRPLHGMLSRKVVDVAVKAEA